MGSRFIVLGSSREQVLFAEACHGEQRDVVVFDRGLRPNRLPSWIGYRQVDLLNAPKVVQAVLDEGASGVSSGFLEAPIPAMIAARQALGIRSIPSPEAVAVTLSKSIMGDLARSIGIPVPRSYGPSETYGRGPLLVKPADRAGQVGIRRASNRDEVERAIAYALQFSRTGEVIVQDWVDGIEVNAVTFRGPSGTHQSVLSIRERLSGEIPIATKHVYSSKSQQSLATVDSYSRALGERLAPSGGVFYSQYIVGLDGVWLLDCGMRLPGGLMHLVVLHATGVNLLSAECQWASGKSWDTRVSTEPKECVQIQFLTSTPGPVPHGLRVDQLSETDVVGNNIQSVLVFSDRLATRAAVDASDRYVAIVAAGDDCGQVADDLDTAKSQVLQQVASWLPAYG